jgi:hypothetical protein
MRPTNSFLEKSKKSYSSSMAPRGGHASAATALKANTA